MSFIPFFCFFIFGARKNKMKWVIIITYICADNRNRNRQTVHSAAYTASSVLSNSSWMCCWQWWLEPQLFVLSELVWLRASCLSNMWNTSHMLELISAIVPQLQLAQLSLLLIDLSAVYMNTMPLCNAFRRLPVNFPIKVNLKCIGQSNKQR